MFKYIFGDNNDKEIPQHFVNTILQDSSLPETLRYETPIKLVKVQVDEEQPLLAGTSYTIFKNIFIDIYMESQDGSKYLVEMQVIFILNL